MGPASMQFYRALAEKKLSRFKQFAAIYPECCWMFLGDNGQVTAVVQNDDITERMCNNYAGWPSGGLCSHQDQISPKMQHWEHDLMRE